MTVSKPVSAAAVVVAIVLGACAAGGGDEPPPPPAPRPKKQTVSKPAQRSAALVLTQNGLPGLELNRQVLDVSTSDMEAAFDNHDFLNAGQTNTCGLAANEDLGVAAITNTDLAVVAFVVERPDTATSEGIRLGSTTDDIIKAYGKNAVYARDVPSRAGGQLIWVTDLDSPDSEPSASSLHYAFETDTTGTVTRLRAGFWPHVAHVDFCSDKATRTKETGWPLT
jgi:hypothetical protein